MKTSTAVAAIAAVVLAAAGGVAFLATGGGTPGDEVRVRTPSPVRGTKRTRRKEDLTALPPIAPEPPQRDPGPVQPGRGLRYEICDIDTVKQVDWLHAGVAVRRATADLRKFARQVMESGQFVPGDARIQEAEAHLLRAGEPVARKVFSAMTDAEGQRSVFLSHPAWESNALAATLDAWGLPLDAAQEDALRAVWTTYAKEWTDARGGSGEGAWTLDSLAAATKARQKVQRELDRILGDQQRRALWPEEIRGRVGLDLFSAANLWANRVRILPIEEGQEPVGLLATILCDLTGTLDPDERNAAMERARAWVASRPEGWADGPQSYLGRLGFPNEEELFAGLDGLADLVASFQPPPAGAGPVVVPPPNFREILVPIRMEH